MLALFVGSSEEDADGPPNPNAAKNNKNIFICVYIYHILHTTYTTYYIRAYTRACAYIKYKTDIRVRAHACTSVHVSIRPQEPHNETVNILMSRNVNRCQDMAKDVKKI